MNVWELFSQTLMSPAGEMVPPADALAVIVKLAAHIGICQTPEFVPAKMESLLAASDQTRVLAGSSELNEVQVAPLSTER